MQRLITDMAAVLFVIFASELFSRYSYSLTSTELDVLTLAAILENEQYS